MNGCSAIAWKKGDTQINCSKNYDGSLFLFDKKQLKSSWREKKQIHLKGQ